MAYVLIGTPFVLLWLLIRNKMNRIILVGNGFDLAHGLETKYEHFINWYWDRWGMLLRSCGGKRISDGLCSFVLKDEVGLAGWYLVPSFHYSIYPRNISNREFLEAVKNDDKVCDYKMHSAFLAKICNSIKAKGWVDIEADYYTLLVECIEKKVELARLNNDFTIIQKLLVEYLSDIQENHINEGILNENTKQLMLSPFYREEIAISSKKKWCDFVVSRVSTDKQSYSFLLKDYGAINIDNKILDHIGHKEYSVLLNGGKLMDSRARQLLLPEKIMLLNFNYTRTADLYLPKSERFIVNHIHGELSNPVGVIFGYGDESDDEYKSLVKQNDNEYLKHTKTCKYLETDKYRQLLSFINSAPYQVCIWGHSCGLSNKTMLNTLFEHNNCLSIKPYYYASKDGKDNYLDIIQNISRNFTDMKLMRDRVVNKTFCEPLPQLN